MRLVTPRKILIIVIMFFGFIGLSALGRPSQNEKIMVVTMVGIDRTADEYEVSVKAVIPAPNENGSSSEKVFSGTGDSIALAMNNITIQVGKQMGLAHCNLIALADPLFDQDVEDVTDYFVRTKRVGKNAILIGCGESAKDFMFATADMSNNLLLKADAILEYSAGELNASAGTLDDFYKGYESNSAISLIPSIQISTDSKNGIEVKTENTSSGQSGESGGSEEKKYFVNDGSTIVLKKGRKQWQMTPEEVRAMNYFRPTVKQGQIMVDKVTDRHLQDATVTLNVLSKETKIKADFKNGVPIIKVQVSMKVNLDEIVKSNGDEQNIDQFENVISQQLIDRTKEIMTKRMTDFFELMKDKKCDVINIYKTFYQTKYNKWEKYLDSLENQDDYLQGIRLELKLDIKAGL